ncbi:MAG: hypothetical protein LJF06_05085 [Gemmatimonadetes bacterium]|nr:hypothetical protein [Gemmatimonadota bacterium]
MNDENLPALPPDSDPEVVEEARRTLGRLRLIGVGGFAGLVALAFILLAASPFAPFFLLPLLVWGFVALVIYEIFPIGRNASWARRVLKRWDELRVDRAFDQLGAARDPRLESAAAMAARITADPATGDHTKGVVALVLRRLRSAMDDLRLLDLANQSPGAGGTTRPDPELRIQLEARIAALTGALADVYRASLARDEARVRELAGHLEDLTHRLEAEAEVEGLLESGPDKMP